MIISANRMSTMNGNFVIAANESYGVEDIGRILMENEMNDMAIFNAALKSDMYELKCRHEGTLLESELQALSEGSVKDFFNSIIEKLKKFWAKMKGAFKKAYAMVTAYCVRNGKAFLTANKKAIAELKDDTKVSKVWVAKGNVGVESLAEFNFTVEDIVNKVKGNTELESTKDFTDLVMSMALSKINYTQDGVSDEGLFKFMKKALFEEKAEATVRECGGKANLMKDLQQGTKPIMELKKAEKKMEKSIKESIKKLQNEAKNAISKLEKDDHDGKSAEEKKIAMYKHASTGLTNGMASIMRSCIRLVKFRLAQDRIILAKAIGVQAHVESTLMESMILAIKEEAEDMEDTGDLNAEEQEIVDAVLDAVEEKIKEIDADDIDVDGEDDE